MGIGDNLQIFLQKMTKGHIKILIYGVQMINLKGQIKFSKHIIKEIIVGRLSKQHMKGLNSITSRLLCVSHIK